MSYSLSKDIIMADFKFIVIKSHPSQLSKIDIPFLILASFPTSSVEKGKTSEQESFHSLLFFSSPDRSSQCRLSKTF